jgi:hypothetical protein
MPRAFSRPVVLVNFTGATSSSNACGFVNYWAVILENETKDDPVWFKNKVITMLIGYYHHHHPASSSSCFEVINGRKQMYFKYCTVCVMFFIGGSCSVMLVWCFGRFHSLTLLYTPYSWKEFMNKESSWNNYWRQMVCRSNVVGTESKK